MKKYEIKHEMSLLPTIRFYMSQSHVLLLLQSLRLQIIVIVIVTFVVAFFLKKIKNCNDYSYKKNKFKRIVIGFFYKKKKWTVPLEYGKTHIHFITYKSC